MTSMMKVMNQERNQNRGQNRIKIKKSRKQTQEESSLKSKLKLVQMKRYLTIEVTKPVKSLTMNFTPRNKWKDEISLSVKKQSKLKIVSRKKKREEKKDARKNLQKEEGNNHRIQKMMSQFLNLTQMVLHPKTKVKNHLMNRRKKDWGICRVSMILNFGK